MEKMDIIFGDNDTTQERLVKATQALLALYGYNAATTRMIANTAQVTLSTINFHFGSKENLVNVAVRQAAEQLNSAYAKLADEVSEFLQQTPVDKEKAWYYIDRLLSDRLKRSLDERVSWINVGIAEHENDLPDSSRGLLSHAAIDRNEKVLAELILAVSDSPDPFRAAVISRSINAAIMTFMEKPLLREYMAEGMGVDFSDERRLEKELHDYFMQSIAVAAKGTAV